MDRIVNEIKSIKRVSAILITKGIRYISYDINQEETRITVQLPEFGRPKRSDEIVASNANFINGFKVVKTVNGEYAYVREADNSLLPFRFDVAFDFNEYGYAMVGKDGTVSWINKEFKHLNRKGKMVEEQPGKTWTKDDGWQGIGAFSKGVKPLSMLYDGRGRFGTIAYYEIEGRLKEFYEYDGEEVSSYPYTHFSSGTEFDEDGYASANGYLLSENGILLSPETIIEKAMKKGLIGDIIEEAKRNLNGVGRTLQNQPLHPQSIS